MTYGQGSRLHTELDGPDFELLLTAILDTRAFAVPVLDKISNPDTLLRIAREVSSCSSRREMSGERVVGFHPTSREVINQIMTQNPSETDIILISREFALLLAEIARDKYSQEI